MTPTRPECWTAPHNSAATPNAPEVPPPISCGKTTTARFFNRFFGNGFDVIDLGENQRKGQRP